MTREERVKVRDDIRAKAEELVTKLNQFEIQISKGEPVDVAEKSKVEADLKDKVGEYDAAAKALCYEDCYLSGDAILEAVKVRQYASITIKDKQEEGCPMEHHVETRMKDIDLLDMNKRLGGELGYEKNWPHIAQKMNFLLTVDRAKGLGIDPKGISDSYTMTEIAKEFDMGKNPVSNTNMLKTMQTVIKAMLGEEYKPKSHDVVFLKSVYAKKGKKALSVQCADHRRFVGYIADVCHHIVTGEPYEVESREIKKK